MRKRVIQEIITQLKQCPQDYWKVLNVINKDHVQSMLHTLIPHIANLDSGGGECQRIIPIIEEACNIRYEHNFKPFIHKITASLKEKPEVLNYVIEAMLTSLPIDELVNLDKWLHPTTTNG